jgi:hypothetical protein
MEYQSLPVSEQVPTGMPTSGEEYLALVRKEARQTPSFFTSKKRNAKYESSTILVDHQLNFLEPKVINELPSKDLPTLEWFNAQRHRYHILKSKLYQAKKINIDLQQNNLNNLVSQECKMGILNQLTHIQTIQMMEYILNANDFTLKKLLWIYGLLVRLDLLIEADDIYLLRLVCKKLRAVRSEGETFVGLTLIIIIIANEFGQKDLGDEYRPMAQ